LPVDIFLINLKGNRPGETQQFNYVSINDAPAKDKEIKYGDIITGQRDTDSFYLVDLPDSGYAAIPDYHVELVAAACGRNFLLIISYMRCQPV